MSERDHLAALFTYSSSARKQTSTSSAGVAAGPRGEASEGGSADEVGVGARRPARPYSFFRQKRPFQPSESERRPRALALTRAPLRPPLTPTPRLPRFRFIPGSSLTRFRYPQPMCQMIRPSSSRNLGCRAKVKKGGRRPWCRLPPTRETAQRRSLRHGPRNSFWLLLSAGGSHRLRG